MKKELVTLGLALALALALALGANIGAGQEAVQETRVINATLILQDGNASLYCTVMPPALENRPTQDFSAFNDYFERWRITLDNLVAALQSTIDFINDERERALLRELFRSCLQDD